MTYNGCCKLPSRCIFGRLLYQLQNAYHSAISSTHENVDGVSVGSHPAVAHFLDGIFHSRPPQPKYAFNSNDVVFRPLHLAKQSRSSRPVANFFFPSFPEDSLSCPVVMVKAYEGRTEVFQAKLSVESRSRLFLSWIGQHSPMSICTKCFMEEPGINISIFKAHSIRGESCSVATGAGVTTKDILDTAD